MRRLHANISTLFTELEPLARPAAAAGAGFDAVECWWPFATEEPPPDERRAFVAAIRDAGVQLRVLNLDGGDLAAGERGILSHPHQAGRFSRNLVAAVELAHELGCTVLNALYGNRLPGLDPREQAALAREHLAAAAAAAAAIDATVVVEALNPWENPTYPLHHVSQVVSLIDEVERHSGAPVRCLFDVYHAQRAQGELIGTIARYAAAFGSVQLADAPGRAEPGTGEIAFPRVLAALAEAGYEGPVALEYVPSTTTDASLGCVPALEAALDP